MGLGRTPEAAAVTTQTLARDPASAPLQVVAIQALDRDRNYAAAAELAGRTQVELPTGLSLTAAPPGFQQDFLMPTLGLSLAVPVSITLGNFDPAGGGAVTDYDFLPPNRPFDDISPWCRRRGALKWGASEKQSGRP